MSLADSLHALAHHEAGHSEVSMYLTGLPARIDIWKDGNGVLQGMCFPRGASQKGARELIAVAGACAQTLADPRCRSYSSDALHAKLLASMSAIDEALFGEQRYMSTAAFLRSALGAEIFNRGLNLCEQLAPSISARARLEISNFHRREAAGVAAYA
jgi:hypothetical protein